MNFRRCCLLFLRSLRRFEEVLVEVAVRCVLCVAKFLFVVAGLIYVDRETGFWGFVARCGKVEGVEEGNG